MIGFPSILVACGKGAAVRVKTLERSGVPGIDIRVMTPVAPSTPEALSPTAEGFWLPVTAASELARALLTVAEGGDA